jgi:hypothetical protein
VTVQADQEPISFERHIKPLFRPADRSAMTFAFDLWDVDDVRANAGAILGRLRDGSMPCDTGWPSEAIELFGRWMETGARD